MTKAALVAKELPCPDCGSSDALCEYDDGHSYCFSCRTDRQPEDAKEPKEPKERPMSTTKKSKVTLKGEPKALRTRKLREETCAAYGYHVYGNRHLAPYYYKGKLGAIHGRGPDKKFWWDGDMDRLELFGQHMYRQGGKRVVVTEGELDCLSVAQCFKGWPCVSIPSGASSAAKYVKQNLEFLSSYDEVVFAFDNDEPGREATEECAQLLPSGRAKVVGWPKDAKDFSDLLQAGRVKEISSLVFNAPVWRPGGIVCGVDLEDELNEYYEERQDPDFRSGEMLPYPRLDEMTDGCRTGEMWLYCAGTGMGKSTLVHEIMYPFLLSGKHTIGIIALEETVKQAAMRYMSLHLNRVVRGSTAGVSKKDWDAAFKATVGSGRLHFHDHFGSLAASDLLSKIRYMAVALECDFIVLDHVSIAVSGLRDGDERRVLDNLMTDLRSLISETGVGIHTISHLNRPQQGSHEEGGRITLAHLRGSGALGQLPDVVVACERDSQTDDLVVRNQVRLRVLKNRPNGTLGPADLLQYDSETGRIGLADETAQQFEDADKDSQF